MFVDQMNLSLAIPEIALALFACVFLIADSVTKGRILPILHNIVVLFCIGLGVYCLAQVPTEDTGLAFSNMYIADSMALALKGFSALAIAFTLIVGANYAKDRDMFKGELHALVLFTLLGQMIMISANNLLLVYLGVELLSLSLYAAVAMQRDNVRATEAAMKYFVLGALASGFLLYGMSMIYGATGSLNHSDIAFAATAAVSGQKSIIFVFGIVFLVAGLAFKLGVVPFHMWVPDVYQGSPSISTLLISGAPKLAAFAMMMRLLVDGLFVMAFDWQNMLMVLAIASLAIGNLTAIAQTSLKRMLAYSTIAQMGFMLLGFLSGVTGQDTGNAAQAYSAAMFYSITYVLTTLGTFGVIMVMSRKGFEVENISDLKGLNKRAPWLALIMLLLMFSLAGIPPMMGFAAKLSVLKALLATGQVWLAVYAVMFSLVGAFYYIRIVKTMYFEAPSDNAEIVMGNDARAVLGLNGLAVIALGLLPAPLMAYCMTVIQQTLAG
ncbi:MAG: NADH-quinone oxidoreductase subunit NuoN [Limnobacter sp.]|uniref:NADH-quinone oxidoreductase subunit NuoN n=1 Tax=Limnobacter sp. TaxID=2003368 RepID=UPI0022BDC35D|nr:NADH-quinone oxidoreductase subunit NuoN [Limnobacter sp.]MCZ8015727.1 NADH-quinone oxidoreductase subunit NuoN [Limnobacter sp.]